MNYTIKEILLKERGYTFQKLYASNYKCYHKKINKNYTLWLWVAKKTIEVNGWHQHTKSIIDFYLNNILDKNYIKIQINHDTGDIQFYDYAEYSKVIESGCWNTWIEKYESYHEVLLVKDSMNELIKEIEYLTK